MSDELPPRPRGASMPSLIWGLLGVLVVALFVLALRLLGPTG